MQVVARERLTNGKASAPVSLRVSVGDENDNAPILRPHPAITIQAGRSRRRIAMMNATDLDEEDSLRYRVVEVEPVSGKKTFYVNPVNGALEVISSCVFSKLPLLMMTRSSPLCGLERDTC